MDKAKLSKFLDESPEQQQETAEAFSQLLQERYGEAPMVLKVLREHRPDLFSAQAFRVLSRAGTLEDGTAELIAIAAAAALRSEHSIRTHVDLALGLGVTQQQVLEALVISATIAESSTQAVAFREYLRLPETAAVEAPPPGTVRRRRGRPRTFRDRQAFWDELLQEFRRQMPKATVSGSASQRVRSVRLGRGQQARLEWAFRRRRGFSVQLVLNGATPGENQARLQELEGERRALERETDARLVFEAGRGRQARVAAHYRGSPRLNEAMRDWAVDRMVRFHAAFRARLEERVEP